MTEKTDMDDLLLSYATGGLDEALSLVVASHLTLSPENRARVAEYEALGGAMIEEIEPVELSESARDSVLARLDEDDDASEAAPAAAPRPSEAALDGHALPAPLRGYVGPGIGKLRWKRIMSGVREAEFPIGGERQRARLMWIDSGVAVPKHSHRGFEATLVLEGAYTDTTGLYDRGALQLADAALDQPARLGGGRRRGRRQSERSDAR